MHRGAAIRGFCLALACCGLAAPVAAQALREAFREDFDAGTLDTTRWAVIPEGGALPAFVPRGAGRAVHVRAEQGNAGLATRLSLVAPYQLEFDFVQPANEAGGYRLVVAHPRHEGNAWWFEFDREGVGVWTTWEGSWSVRWTAAGMKPDTWYRVTVTDEPERVRFRILDGTGTEVAASDWLPHDLGSSGALTFRADSGGGLRGALYDSIVLALPEGATVHRTTTTVDRALHAAMEATPAGAEPTCEVRTRDGLALDVDAHGAVRRARLAGRDLAVTAAGGGFWAWDITEPPRYERFAARNPAAPSAVLDLACEGLGLALRGSLEGVDDRIVVTGELIDRTGKDRAVVVLWSLPLDASGWRWGDDLNHSRDISEPGRYQHVMSYGAAGKNGGHLISLYPWASLTRDDAGLMLARPLDWPRLCAAAYDLVPGQSCVVVRFDLGLSAQTRKFPSRASFRFVLSRIPESAWGFRAAAQRYYDLFPHLFVRRVDREGLWHLWLTTQVPNPEELALVYHEQEPYSEDRVTFDDTHGGYSFTYSEPSTLWQKTTRYDGPQLRQAEFLADARQRAAQSADALSDYPFWTQPVRLPDVGIAQALLNSYIGGDGDLSHFPAPPDRVAVNCGGDPELPRPSRASLWFDYEGRPALSDPRVDGAYLDSLGWHAFDAAEDFRVEHWAVADIPLIPSFRAGAPALLAGFSHYELYAAIGSAMHERGKLVLANTFPYCHTFYAHLVDVLGAGEAANLEAFHDAERLSFCRALAYRKPVSHMNYAYLKPDVPLADKERGIQRNLIYAVWPGTGDGGKVEPLEAFRPLLRSYAPILRGLCQAGWEPITLARATPGQVLLERYGAAASGTLFLAAHNPTPYPAEVEISLDDRLLVTTPTCPDLVTGQAYARRDRRLNLALKPWQTAVLALRQ